MIQAADAAYHYVVHPEHETNYYVHGSTPNYSPINVTVYQQAAPEWIQGIPLPELIDRSTDNELCNCYQFIDYQINIPTQTCFKHRVYKIWNAFNLHALCNLSIDFDPSFQTLTLHECKVLRNGQWINKLDMNELRVIQQEENLDENLYSAQLAALLFLEDIREGDLLDISYSLNGFFFPEFSMFRALQDQCRWEKYHLRVLKPKNRAIQTRVVPSDWGTLSENDNEVIWQMTPCPKYVWESNQPEWYLPYALIEMTQFSNWNEVASKMASLYSLDNEFKNDAEVIELVNRWKNSESELEKQALLAIRYVQDEVRYTGIEVGKSAVQPANSLATFQRRFGDCKDKTQLLRSFLDMLGIQSDPCLVSTELCKTIKNYLPNPSIFNHVILQINLDNHISYVDATSLYQGGDLSQFDCPYGMGLIISEKTQDLVEIHNPLIHPEIDCQTSFEMNNSDLVQMNTTIHFYGNEANYYRGRIKYKGLEKTFESFHNYIESRLGEYKSLKPVRIQDDRTTNHLTASFELQIDSPWTPSSKKSSKYMKFTPYFLRDFVLQDIDTDRNSPIALPTSRIKESILVQGGYILGNTETIEHKSFTLKSFTPDNNRVDYELISHMNELQPDDLTSYVEKLDEALEEIRILIKRR